MNKLLKQAEDYLTKVLESVGIKKEIFDKVVLTSGWVILAYIILLKINKNRKAE